MHTSPWKGPLLLGHLLHATAAHYSPFSPSNGGLQLKIKTNSHNFIKEHLQTLLLSLLHKQLLSAPSYTKHTLSLAGVRSSGFTKPGPECLPYYPVRDLQRTPRLQALCTSVSALEKWNKNANAQDCWKWRSAPCRTLMSGTGQPTHGQYNRLLVIIAMSNTKRGPAGQRENDTENKAHWSQYPGMLSSQSHCRG